MDESYPRVNWSPILTVSRTFLSITSADPLPLYNKILQVSFVPGISKLTPLGASVNVMILPPSKIYPSYQVLVAHHLQTLIVNLGH